MTTTCETVLVSAFVAAIVSVFYQLVRFWLENR